MLKILLGSFGAFPTFDNLISHKRLIAECNIVWHTCVVRVRGAGRRWSGLRKLSRGFSAARSPAPTSPSPGSLSSGLPQSSPSLSTPYSFPYCESLLRQWVGSTTGAAIPLSLSLTSLFSRRRRCTLSQSVCLFSLSLSLSLLTLS